VTIPVSLTVGSPAATITSVTVSCPSSAQVNTTGTCTATVAGTGSYSSAVTWSASAGSIDSSGNFTAPATAQTVTITATSQQDNTKKGTATVTVTLVPPAPTNSVSLAISPSSYDTNTPITLTATAGGTETGTMNYTFWWNCSSATTSVVAATQACGDPNNAANGAKFDGVATASQAATHTYGTAGTYSPKVIIERGAASPAQDKTSITVTNVSGPNSYFDCVNNACKSVQGIGLNRCATDSDCGCVGSCGGGGGGGGGHVHAVCDAAHNACVNVDGAGVDACSSDAACGGVVATHLACESNSCVIVAGSGIDQCSEVGSPCVGGPAPTLSFSVSPSSLIFGDSATASWTSTNVTSCVASSSPAEGDWAVGASKATNNASGQLVMPSLVGATSETYSLTCTGSGGTVTQSKTIAVNAPPAISCSSFSASPTAITPPGQATLSWHCVNAASCTINGAAATNPDNGSVVVTPTSTTQYQLSCQGAGGWGSANSSVVVTVGGGGVHEINP
jgi:hypothetical protein